MSKYKISLCICVWGNSHLLERSLHTYTNQDFPKEDFEIIIIDDNSPDDVWKILKPYEDKLNMKYIRLDHDYGMRGCTVGFNTAFRHAESDILAETTGETMFHPDTIRRLYEPHKDNDRLFVAMKTYNLIPKIQMEIDEYDWKGEIMNISKHPEWDDPWVQANIKHKRFDTHQTCSIRAEVFWEITNGNGFLLAADYGSEDPIYSGIRERSNVKNLTYNDKLLIHQWHPPFQYYQSKGMAPMLNKFAHTNSNYMNDKSGHIDEYGTAKIWDKMEQTDGTVLYPNGCPLKLSDNEINGWKAWDSIVVSTGNKWIKKYI